MSVASYSSLLFPTGVLFRHAKIVLLLLLLSSLLVLVLVAVAVACCSCSSSCSCSFSCSCSCWFLVGCCQLLLVIVGCCWLLFLVVVSLLPRFATNRSTLLPSFAMLLQLPRSARSMNGITVVMPTGSQLQNTPAEADRTCSHGENSFQASGRGCKQTNFLTLVWKTLFRKLKTLVLKLLFLNPRRPLLEKVCFTSRKLTFPPRKPLFWRPETIVSPPVENVCFPPRKQTFFLLVCLFLPTPPPSPATAVQKRFQN